MFRTEQQLRSLEDLKADYNYLLLSASHPRVAKFIELSWGEIEMEQYIDKLMFDTRDHSRHGFDKTVIKSLLAIQQLHQKEFPNLKREDIVNPTYTAWGIL